MEKYKHYIVFEMEEYEEVQICESEIIFQCENYYISKKTLDSSTLILTFNQNGFLRGHVYAGGKEFAIESYIKYSSLQIKNWAYDNIAVIKI